MSVLVDTSVWIRFLSNQAPFAAELDRLLADDAVAGHEFVYGELLVGDRGGRERLLIPVPTCVDERTVLQWPHAESV